MKSENIISAGSNGLRSLKGFKALFAVYLIVFAAFLVALLFYKQSIFYSIDSWTVNGFGSSLFASFLEDFMFFGIIGALSIYVTTRKPEDEDISSRIRSVTNGQFVSDEAKSYFEETTRAVLAYHSCVSVRVKIKDYDKAIPALKIYVEFNCTIRNMCKDVKYTEIKGSAVVRPDRFVKGTWGNVSHLTITDRKHGFPQKKVVVEGEVIELDKDGYQEHIPYTISENSEADYKLCYTLWSELAEGRDDINNWFYTVVSLYTDVFSLSVENELADISVPLIVKYRNRSTGDQGIDDVKRDDEVRPKESKCLVQNIRLYPEDKFYIFFNLAGKQFKEGDGNEI